jgi:IS1 family transposase
VKGDIAHIPIGVERNNCLLRHYIKTAFRKPVAFLKAVESLESF